MAREISNYDDVIDSRDVIERIAELEAERDDAAERGALAEEWAGTPEEGELVTLHALASEGENLADWVHGETLIRDSYFMDYAQELAEDIGAIDRDAPWPACHIDWEAAATALLVAYTDIDFNGVTYWARS